MSIVRQNIMNSRNYTPYCGGKHCPTMPRTVFTGSQFKCPSCKWESEFEPAFIKQYKEKWGK